MQISPAPDMHPETAGAALSVRNLTVDLPAGMDRPYAVEDISFDLAAGKILCVIGESGSGKSVTANAVMGLLPKAIKISSGSIRLGDVELTRVDPVTLRSLRGRVVSMIFQDPLSALNPLMTVGAQITEVMMAHGVGTPASRRNRALELLVEVGLPDPELMIHQYPFRLSGGQRQRVMIAMALALEPTILIADEPTTALDVTTQAQILALIRDIQRRKGMSVMLITHDFGVVADVADYVVVMEKGRLVEQGPADVVLKAPTHPYTKRLIAAVPRLTATDRVVPAQEEAPVLEVEGLVKTYRSGSAMMGSLREVRAVQGVSFTLAPGRTLGVVGESGSGKSTLGRLVIKLLDNDGGRILFQGQDIAPMPESRFRALRPQIQMVFQDPFASLNPRATVGRSLTVGPVAHGTSPATARAEARALLEVVGLNANSYGRYPHEFSGGQRQRIGIARALMFKPRVLIADEAVSALDVSVQAQVLELLDRIQRETGVAMIFITHDLRVASQICNEIMVMQKGRMVEMGPPSQIFLRPQSDYTRELVAAVPGGEPEMKTAQAQASAPDSRQETMAMTKRESMIAEMSRRNALRLMALTGAAGVFAPSLLGRGAAAKGAAKGRIIVGVSQEPTALNPLTPKIEVDDNIHFSIYDPLFYTDPDGVIQPRLAVEVPTQENGGISADGMEWRVKLRDDVTWHDGAPFTAEDVKFTIELIVNPEFRAWRTAGHRLVRDITVVSPTEITWRMEKPFSPYLSFLTETFIIPKHAFDGVANPNEAPFNQAPIGTGAFKFVKRVAGDHIELAANADYFDDGPYIESLVFKYIPDLTVLYTQFKSGDIDLIGRQFITPDNYEDAQTIADREIVLSPAPSVETVYFNLEKPQFKELAVRQAIYAAIDKEAIIEALYYGVPVPTESYMPPRSFFFNPDLPKQQFDVAAANKLLDDAGWVPGADGIREKDGVRLSFTNSTTAGNHLREQTQQFMQQTLREAGIEMKIDNLPAAVIWGDFWEQSQFESVIVGLVFTIGSDPDVTDRLHSSAIPAQGGSGANQAQFRNDEVDRLLEEGTQIFDPDQRRTIYWRVQEIVRQELPFLPIFSGSEVRGWKSDIMGVQPNPNNRSEAWDASQWRWAD